MPFDVPAGRAAGAAAAGPTAGGGTSTPWRAATARAQAACLASLALEATQGGEANDLPPASIRATTRKERACEGPVARSS